MTEESNTTAPPPATTPQRTATLWTAIALMVYLLLMGCGATAVIIVNFSAHQEDPEVAAGAVVADEPAAEPSEPAAEPSEPSVEPSETDEPAAGAGTAKAGTAKEGDENTVLPGEEQSYFYVGNTLKTREQILILLALCGGIAGSFIHAAQSLVSYLGNKSFKPSWAPWYFLRPWIGGTLGMAVYFTLQAGLMGGVNALNTHGVVALGLMGGWFSKVASDKLQEVFETLFKSDEDKKRADKLDPKKPTLLEISPNRVPETATEISLVGQNFLEGATVEVDAKQFPTEFKSDKELRFALSHLGDRPAAGKKISLAVRNPEGTAPLSESREITFQ